MRSSTTIARLSLAALAACGLSACLTDLTGTLCDPDGTCGGGLVCDPLSGRCVAPSDEAGGADSGPGSADARTEDPLSDGGAEGDSGSGADTGASGDDGGAADSGAAPDGGTDGGAGDSGGSVDGGPSGDAGGDAGSAGDAASDAGLDAGTSSDAGPPADAGFGDAGADAGRGDGGTGPICSGGFVLDYHGGVHAFAGGPGTALSVRSGGTVAWDNTSMWAQALALGPVGSDCALQGGWILRATGVLTHFGHVSPVSTGINLTGRRAVAVSLNPNNPNQGYIMDDLGTVHRFGGAPAIDFPALSWSGAVGAGLVVVYDAFGNPTGAWRGESVGGLHPTAGLAPLAAPYYPGHYFWIKYHRLPDGGLYAVGRFGTVHPIESTGVSSGVSLGLFPWAPNGTWDRSYDPIRDVVLYNPTLTSFDMQRAFVCTKDGKRCGGDGVPGFGEFLFDCEGRLGSPPLSDNTVWCASGCQPNGRSSFCL